MTVLTPANAFPGIPAPQHLSGQSSVTNYRYPGAVQPLSTVPTVLTYAEAFPGIPFPNHLAGQSQPQNYLFPGALQPIVPTPPTPPAVEAAAIAYDIGFVSRRRTVFN
jgi:hypothetical protein